jgi:hypothetical protein
MSIAQQLIEISADLYQEESQLRLQQILTEKFENSEMKSLKVQELLHKISMNLTKSLLESKLYHMINSSKLAIETEGNFTIGKSVLDLNGDFIWFDKSTENIFQYNKDILSKSNLFSLMAPCSIRYLFSKYSQELLYKSRRIIISYIISNGVELTSRCTLVYYSPEPGVYKKGVFAETRKARHKVFNYCSLAVSPLLQYSDQNQLFTPIQITPSSFCNPELCSVDLENLRITPFLKGDSPYKKRKIDEYMFSEFKS